MPNPGTLRVPHCLQEVNKLEKLYCISKSYPGIKGLPDSLPSAAFNLYPPRIFDPHFRKDERNNWPELNYSCVPFMSHLACHSLSTPNYMSNTGVECLLLYNFALVLLFFLSKGEGKYGMFLLLPCLCHQSPWSTHVC